MEHLYGQDTGLTAENHSLCAAATDAVETIIAHLADPDTALPDTGQLQASLASAAARVESEPERIDESASSETPDAVDLDINLEDIIDTGAEEPPEDIPAETEDVSTADVASDEPAVEIAGAPEFDAEIAAIFLEEAAEILEASDAALASLGANNRDAAPLAELQRHLHTLKGGARMAGIVAMGDFSHELESLLIRINQGGMGLDDSAYSLLQASIDDLHRMREEVPGGSVAPPAGELLGRLAGVVEATMVTPALSPDEVEPVAESGQPLTTETEEPDISVETPSDADEITASEGAGVLPADDVAEVEFSDEELLEEGLSGTFSVPEPEGLGELARELTSESPSQEPTPLPDELAPPLPTPEITPRKELARVESSMLENLLNAAGEISIFHSRLNQQMSSIQFNLDELGQTVRRFQQQLRQLEMETEAQILFKHQGDASSDDKHFDPLELDRYSKIQQLSRGLTETASDVSSIKDLLQNIASDTESILSQQARTTSEMQDSLMRTRMVSFEQHIPRLSRLVRQQAVESSKQVNLKVEGSSGELDRQVMEKLLPPLEHMLRNAIIHGIETPEVRAAAGKPADAVITIRIGREGSQVLIDVADDGAGINTDAVRAKAIEQGLIKSDQQLTDEEVMQLILESGLTTAEKLTQSAGRGIGMDVVVSEIAKLGGMLAIESEPGKGCTFTVRLPYTLAITQAFIVKSGGETFALPLPTVEGVVRISRQEFEDRMAEDDPSIEHDGRIYHLRHMGLYLGLGPARLDPDDSQVSLILVEAGVNSTALISDVRADSREIVVKPIGPQLATIRGLAGATILGDGRIVIILDAGALVRSALSDVILEKPVRIEEEDLPPLALVVDDSITMRRVTQRLLERNNMRVITAKDGIEAVEVLQDHLPDIIFLDVEMPRMDGYEFAAHVRNTPRTAELPIIMVTSRVGEKHRARAIELGVNDYLGKPYQEHELLDAMRNILGDSFDSSQEPRERDVVS
jgi:chemosensory pili system protein ChpA (sensor histidine kinase/response regulator)